MENITLQMAQRGVIRSPSHYASLTACRPATYLLSWIWGVFILSPGRSVIDMIADKVATQWTEDGQPLATMLKALGEERDRRGH